MPPIFNDIAEVIPTTVVFLHVVVLGDAASYVVVSQATIAAVTPTFCKNKIFVQIGVHIQL
jgi:hypothetical protein